MHIVRLPPGAEEHLRRDHPRLLELRQRYQCYAAEFENSLWSPATLKAGLDLRTFRDDNVYTWQVRGGVEPVNYLVTAYYARDIDHLHISGALFEDGYFGVHTFDFNGRQVSRDLLDSIIQINFLDRHMDLSGIPDATVLDIGAGYGRLPWRLSRSLPNLKRIWSTDAIAESTFISEYYLSFCQADSRVDVLPLDGVAERVRGEHIHVATNVQSFTECTMKAIEWWMGVLAKARVDYLMIVPSSPDELLSTEADGSRRDFLPLVERHGFRLKVKEFAYHGAPSVRTHGVYGGIKYWLFEAA